MGEPFNDLKQVDLSLEAAKNMVGSATMTMDKEHLQNAQDAVNNAKALLQEAKQNETGVDTEFLQAVEKKLQEIEHQLHEAMD